ncbi:uncharacterized protein LOC119730094 [Patiria miniata]|uniref:Protein CUSTOS n=1 Tax=Patiria miniata TaxID=46514 RepID=A0A914A506_PATMI|nr:uncharacterized protein LOC119730094 [Patiria miniata]
MMPILCQASTTLYWFDDGWPRPFLVFSCNNARRYCLMPRGNHSCLCNYHSPYKGLSCTTGAFYSLTIYAPLGSIPKIPSHLISVMIALTGLVVRPIWTSTHAVPSTGRGPPPTCLTCTSTFSCLCSFEKCCVFGNLTDPTVFPKGTKSGIGTEQKKSLRNQEDFEEQGDYRNVDATPEVKTFIAKKLTSWLDSSISVIDGQTSGGSTAVAAVDNPDDDFHLFSTSKLGLPVKEESQAVKRKQRPPSSSSDSDSDEERAKLSSVAVSYDQILQSSSSWHPDSQDPQVTSNLSPTNPHSTLTPAESSQSIPCNAPRDSEPERHKGLAEGIGSETELKKKKKRRKKKTKTETTSISEAVEKLNESGLPKVIENNQSEEKHNGQQPKDFENGKEVTSEQSERKVKKRKKKKKKMGKSQDTAPQTIHGVDSETSLR